MLSRMRAASSNWLGKAVITVLFSFLILSFAIWGIGDIFKGGVTTTVAKVGKTEIGAEALRQQFQQRITDIQQRSRGFTAEQARTLGVDRQVLNQMIGEAALNEATRNLGMAISDEDIARSLASNAAFRTADGRFNREAFDNYLRNVGKNEAAFIREQKQSTLRVQLGESVSNGFAPPKALLEMVHRYRNEERSISYITIPGMIASSLALPDEAALKALHEQRKSAFRAPEFRKINMMILRPVEFASTLQVTDAELSAAYDRGLAAGRYGTPEKRRVQQILFPSAAEAAAASAKIVGGMTFDALLAEMKIKLEDVDLGTKSRTELLDKAVADAAFALAENTVSAPVTGQFGPVLLRVTSIVAGSAQPLDSMKDTLRADVLAQKVTSDRTLKANVDALHDKIEDLRASGKSLEQVSAEMKRPLTVFEATDASGRNKKGEPNEAIPDQAEVLKAAFLSDRGVDNEAIRTRDNGYIWFEIVSIEPGRERAFDEVREEVSALWRTDEANRQTAAQANALLKRAEAGETMEALATELGVNVETATGVTRNGGRDVSASVAATAFASPVNGLAVASTGQGTDRMILKVGETTVPAFVATEEGAVALEKQLATTMSDELLAQYIGLLQNTLGTTINERSFANATGVQQERR
ncbi:MAG: SurA N-terminal domain-containing protein [Beijerinckiaceae bacterium]